MIVKEGGKVDFFILNQTQWTKWASSLGSKRGTTCAVWRPTQSDVTVLGITNYSVSYVVPDNANHTFMFFNAYINDATVTVSLAW